MTHFSVQVLEKCSNKMLILYVVHVKLLQWFSLDSFLRNITENFYIICYWIGFVFIYWCNEIYFVSFICEDTLIETPHFHLSCSSNRKPSLGTARKSNAASKPGINENMWTRKKKQMLLEMKFLSNREVGV